MRSFPRRARAAATIVVLVVALVGPGWGGALAQTGAATAATGVVTHVQPGPVGAVPRAIRIAKAQVDAQVEQIAIANGVMQNPTGPWVVSWYKETGKLGQVGNAVLAGHVDYWDVGPAVFYHVKDLTHGDAIDVTGADGKVYTYRVAWNKLYDADADAKAIQEIVGPTKQEALTLITCGGPFDYNRGIYLQRRVVRAVRIQG